MKLYYSLPIEESKTAMSQQNFFPVSESLKLVPLVPHTLAQASVHLEAE